MSRNASGLTCSAEEVRLVLLLEVVATLCGMLLPVGADVKVYRCFCWAPVWPDWGAQPAKNIVTPIDSRLNGRVLFIDCNITRWQSYNAIKMRTSAEIYD